MWDPQNTDNTTPGKIILPGGPGGGALTIAWPGGLEAAMQIWLRAYTSPNTRDAYRRDVQRWFAWCHDYGIEVADARRGDVDAYRAELDDHDPPLAPRTRRRRLAVISSFYTYWLIEDALPRNPAAHVRRPRQPDQPSSIALTRPQAADLIAAADADGLRSAIITRLLLETGMRVSELCGAGADDLGSTSGHRTLDIVRKGGKTATLPITPATAHLIDRYLNGRTDGPLLRTSGAKSDGVPRRSTAATSATSYAAWPSKPDCRTRCAR